MNSASKNKMLIYTDSICPFHSTALISLFTMAAQEDAMASTRTMEEVIAENAALKDENAALLAATLEAPPALLIDPVAATRGCRALPGVALAGGGFGGFGVPVGVGVLVIVRKVGRGLEKPRRHARPGARRALAKAGQVVPTRSRVGEM